MERWPTEVAPARGSHTTKNHYLVAFKFHLGPAAFLGLCKFQAFPQIAESLKNLYPEDFSKANRIHMLVLGFSNITGDYPTTSQLYRASEDFSLDQINLAQAVKHGLTLILQHPILVRIATENGDGEVLVQDPVPHDEVQVQVPGPSEDRNVSKEVLEPPIIRALRGMRVALRWVTHICNRQLVWGPMIAHGLAQGRPVVSWKPSDHEPEDRIPGSVEVNGELQPWDCMMHVDDFLQWLREVIIEADAWVKPLDKRSDLAAHITEERAREAADPLLILNNKHVANTLFSKFNVFARPDAPSSLRLIPQGTVLYMMSSDILSKKNFHGCWQQAVFMDPVALGLNAKEKEAWYVTANGSWCPPRDVLLEISLICVGSCAPGPGPRPIQSQFHQSTWFSGTPSSPGTTRKMATCACTRSACPRASPPTRTNVPLATDRIALPFALSVVSCVSWSRVRCT